MNKTAQSTRQAVPSGTTYEDGLRFDMVGSQPTPMSHLSHVMHTPPPTTPPLLPQREASVFRGTEMNLKTSFNQLIKKKKRGRKGKKSSQAARTSSDKQPIRLTESEGHGAVGGMLPLASPFGNRKSRAGGAGPNCTLGSQQERGTAEQEDLTARRYKGWQTWTSWMAQSSHHCLPAAKRTPTKLANSCKKTFQKPIG